MCVFVTSTTVSQHPHPVTNAIGEGGMDNKGFGNEPWDGLKGKPQGMARFGVIPTHSASKTVESIFPIRAMNMAVLLSVSR